MIYIETEKKLNIQHSGWYPHLFTIREHLRFAMFSKDLEFILLLISLYFADQYKEFLLSGFSKKLANLVKQLVQCTLWKFLKRCLSGFLANQGFSEKF